MSIKSDDQGHYICGRCKSKQFYLLSEDPDICDVCGYEGFAKPDTVLPSNVSIDLSKY